MLAAADSVFLPIFRSASFKSASIAFQMCIRDSPKGLPSSLYDDSIQPPPVNSQALTPKALYFLLNLP